jgi:excisionase family DNA binding protein
MAEHTYYSNLAALERLNGRLTLSVDEVATLLNLGRSAAYEAARRGDLPSRRLGRRIVIPVPLLLEWLGIANDNI